MSTYPKPKLFVETCVQSCCQDPVSLTYRVLSCPPLPSILFRYVPCKPYGGSFFLSSETIVGLAKLLSSGVCGCHGFDLTQGDDYRTIFDRMFLMREFMADADSDMKREVVSILCSSPISEGDHLQVRSP